MGAIPGVAGRSTVNAGSGVIGMGTPSTLIDELEDALHSGFADRRTTMLRRVTDLFIGGAPMYSEDQVALFDDVIARIAANIEARARIELSKRMAPVANAPLGVIKALALDDELEIARPVLVESTRLTDEDLVEVAKTKSQGHLLAISTRLSIDPAVTDVLVGRGDQQVARTVANNAGARFSDDGFETLIERSHFDDLLGEIVGLRPDLPQAHFEKLVAAASDAVRAKLAAGNPHIADDITKILARLAERTNDAIAQPARDYTKAKTIIEALFAAKALTEVQVGEFAQQGSFEETAVALAMLCGMPIDAVERSLLDRRADLTLILARGADFSWETTKSILRFATGGMALGPADRDRMYSQFNTLKPESAKRVIRFLKVRVAADGKSPQ